MKIIAVDPGLNGAICYRDDKEILLWDIPTLTTDYAKAKKNVRQVKDYDCQKLIEIMEEIHSKFPTGTFLYATVIIEKANVGTWGKDSATVMYKMGYGYGIIKGLFAGFGNTNTLIVTPQTWKRPLGLIDSTADYRAKKEASRSLAIELFPEVADQLARKKDNDRAEALLMTEWYARDKGTQYAESCMRKFKEKKNGDVF